NEMMNSAACNRGIEAFVDFERLGEVCDVAAASGRAFVVSRRFFGNVGPDDPDTGSALLQPAPRGPVTARELDDAFRIRVQQTINGSEDVIDLVLGRKVVGRRFVILVVNGLEQL